MRQFEVRSEWNERYRITNVLAESKAQARELVQAQNDAIYEQQGQPAYQVVSVDGERRGWFKRLFRRGD